MHAEAIASAMAKIDAACPNLPKAGREEAETRLVEMARAHTPSQVRDVGRELLLRLQPDKKAAAEDPTANRLDFQLGRDGRGHIRANLDPVNFEEFCALITPGAKPRPAADGTPDPRPASLRNADSLTDVVTDCRPRRPDRHGTARTKVTCREPATSPGAAITYTLRRTRTAAARPDRAAYRDCSQPKWPFHLTWTGSVSRQIAQMLACDCDLTVVALDEQNVPLDVGRTRRLVTKQIRTALGIRDGGCAFPGCGRPVAWTHAHHCVPWSEGGPTSLDNTCLCAAGTTPKSTVRVGKSSSARTDPLVRPTGRDRSAPSTAKDPQPTTPRLRPEARPWPALLRG